MPFHYALMPLKTDTRQKIVETEVVHMYQHDENTEARSQMHALTTLRLSTYSHYSDEPNKEMHTVLFTLPHVTHTVHTRANQTDARLCLTYALNHS